MSEADSDNPDDDFTIRFASDSSEDEQHTITPPPSPTLVVRSTSSRMQPLPTSSCASTISRSISTVSSITNSSSPAGRQNSGNTTAYQSDPEIIAYYRAQYDNQVAPLESFHPTPKAKTYYAVVVGGCVGVYSSWDAEVAPYTQGYSGAIFDGHRRFHQAWLQYYKAYEGRLVRIIHQNGDDIAPAVFHMQEALAMSMGAVSLS
ncbi:hypothetical protein V5O48_014378 [Marasmius crinis-equi]|uniref:Ribonuclease H1 N-terminal domain-containing protein n=1 Tax=Marasmius crinis-equi TaxID=585013 RepID=A0ABR3EXI0_9AGAR